MEALETRRTPSLLEAFHNLSKEPADSLNMALILNSIHNGLEGPTARMGHKPWKYDENAANSATKWQKTEKKCQTAYKPGSVPAEASDDHSSGTSVAGRLAQPTRTTTRKPA